MECLFCGMDVGDMPYHRNGEIYCSRECADAETSAEGSLDYEDPDDALDFDGDMEGDTTLPISWPGKSGTTYH